MSPLLLHSNTNQYNINGLLCTYTEMFRIQTCCNHILSAARAVLGAGGNMRGSRNFCQFYLVLSLFYSLQRGPMGEHYFPRLGGVQLFSGGKRGPNANFYRNPYSYLLFSGRGGVRTPYPPLDPHMGSHHIGTIFKSNQIKSILLV